ncbi:unnamed protein product, partial [Amoebophrya sp. A120]
FGIRLSFVDILPSPVRSLPLAQPLAEPLAAQPHLCLPYDHTASCSTSGAAPGGTSGPAWPNEEPPPRGIGLLSRGTFGTSFGTSFGTNFGTSFATNLNTGFFPTFR